MQTGGWYSIRAALPGAELEKIEETASAQKGGWESLCTAKLSSERR
jgi:hypothetical protein